MCSVVSGSCAAFHYNEAMKKCEKRLWQALEAPQGDLVAQARSAIEQGADINRTRFYEETLLGEVYYAPARIRSMPSQACWILVPTR